MTRTLKHSAYRRQESRLAVLLTAARLWESRTMIDKCRRLLEKRR